MRPALLSAAVGAAIAGCSPPPTGFAALGDFELRFSNINSGFAEATFDYDSQKRGCQTLGDDFTAAANGNPASVSEGAVEKGAMFRPDGCIFPSVTFSRPLPVDGSVSLVMNAGPEQVVAEIEGMGNTLTGVPMVTPGEVIHAGQRLQIALGAGYELATWPTFAGIDTDGTNLGHLARVVPPVDGIMEVLLPSDLAPGRQHVTVVATIAPNFTSCEGPARGCHWNPIGGLTASLVVSFEVQP
ncbi:MAG TPA: hypothetical protein VFA20_29960 [Myxococcaceae bacterium]|nr:hypothetical protein [Myxococcaceae bacterium]